MAFIRFAERPVFRNPWAEFERIRQGLDELSRSYVEKGKGQNRANVYPALNIFEEADRLVITAELPGVKAEDLDLSIEGETLTIQGKRDRRQNETGASYHRREIEFGKFQPGHRAAGQGGHRACRRTAEQRHLDHHSAEGLRSHSPPDQSYRRIGGLSWPSRN